MGDTKKNRVKQSEDKAGGESTACYLSRPKGGSRVGASCGLGRGHLEESWSLGQFSIFLAV